MKWTRNAKRHIGVSSIRTSHTRKTIRTGSSSMRIAPGTLRFKNPAKKFDEVEQFVAVEYEQGKPDAALPWDTARPAVSSVWDRMSGVIEPRDPDRGFRGSI